MEWKCRSWSTVCFRWCLMRRNAAWPTRYLLQRGVIVIPKSVHKERMA